MKIRTLDNLSQALEDESSWRKKEISTLFLNALSSTKKQYCVSCIKSAIPIFYSHWEGFLKNAASFYLEYVSYQKLPYSQLKTNFISIACKKTIHEVAATKKTYLYNQLFDFIIYNSESRSQIPYKGIIDTESNLSSNVLKDILDTIGIPFDNYWVTKSFAIDNIMLEKRNKIAHGEKCTVDIEMCKNIHDLTIDIIDYAKTSLENAACLKSFKNERV